MAIVLAALAAVCKPDAPFDEKHLKQLRWLFRAIKDDIHSLPLSQQDLRDLYRCERACMALSEMIGADHPGYPPALETLENTLSAFITDLPPINGPAPDTSEPATQPKPDEASGCRTSRVCPLAVLE